MCFTTDVTDVGLSCSTVKEYRSVDLCIAWLIDWLIDWLFAVIIDGTPCPPMRMLIEKERCAEIPCHTYYWDSGPWQECEPSSAAAASQPSCVDGSRCRTADTHYCGDGTQRRDVVCRKSTGERLPTKRLTFSPTLINVEISTGQSSNLWT